MMVWESGILSGVGRSESERTITDGRAEKREMMLGESGILWENHQQALSLVFSSTHSKQG